MPDFNHLDELRCPNSGLPLKYDRDAETISANNQTIGRVVNAIPRFVDDQHLASFGLQWNKYEVAPPHR